MRPLSSLSSECSPASSSSELGGIMRLTSRTSSSASKSVGWGAEMGAASDSSMMVSRAAASEGRLDVMSGGLSRSVDWRSVFVTVRCFNRTREGVAAKRALLRDSRMEVVFV